MRVRSVANTVNQEFLHSCIGCRVQVSRVGEANPSVGRLLLVQNESFPYGDKGKVWRDEACIYIAADNGQVKKFRVSDISNCSSHSPRPIESNQTTQ